MADLPGTYCRALILMNSDDAGSKVFANVLWYEMLGTAPDWQAAADDLATTLDADIAAQLILCLATDSKYIATRVDITVGGVNYSATNNGSAAPGEVTGDSCADYVAAIIRKKTAHAGREGRGRWFVPCVPELFTNTSVLTPTGVAAYEDLFAKYLTLRTQAGVDFTPVHWSPHAAEFFAITGCVVAPILQTQRRRRLRPPF